MASGMIRTSSCFLEKERRERLAGRRQWVARLTRLEREMADAPRIRAS